MSLTHDIIKMKYVEEGYLPNYPFHMISDSEMCDAFLKGTRSTADADVYEIDSSAPSYFLDTYPCIDESLRSAYQSLINTILYHIDLLKLSTEAEYVLPDWIYSYMLGVVIGPNSSIPDIHDLLVLLGRDNIDDIFTLDAASACLRISTRWVARLVSTSDAHRSPTFFGEPHIIKHLRLAEASKISMREGEVVAAIRNN